MKMGKIHGFYDSQAQLSSHHEFVNKFHISYSYLLYQGVLSAVKDAIRNSIEFHDIDLKVKPVIVFESNIFTLDITEPINISKAKTTEFYNSYVATRIKEPCVISFWDRNLSISSEVVYRSTALCWRATNESKLISFQFSVKSA